MTVGAGQMQLAWNVLRHVPSGVRVRFRVRVRIVFDSKSENMDRAVEAVESVSEARAL